MAKIALVGSSGGHLAQLLLLEPFWARHDRFWVTFDKPDAVSSLSNERHYWCRYPTNRHVGNLLRNTLQAFSLMRRERPDLVLSTGAGAAIPWFVVARLHGVPSAFVEVYDRVDSPTVTGRVAHVLATRFFVQWESQKRFYPRAELVGELL
ncbi:MAG: PssD/Cps14F family polysaccharide biosynthesis glycosyltransferase [Trueperaceae bacterium]